MQCTVMPNQSNGIADEGHRGQHQQRDPGHPLVDAHPAGEGAHVGQQPAGIAAGGYRISGHANRFP